MNLQVARHNLHQQNYSCLIIRDQEIVFTSKESGVRPLLLYIEQKPHIPPSLPLILADKVIGKAAALLAIFLNVKEIYTPLLSIPAKDILMKHQIQIEYDQLVPYIQNRTGTGPCPMETLVSSISDPKEAYEAITSFIATKSI